jgi:hypothetical protein
MRYACPRGIYSRLSRAGVRGETGFVRRRWAAGVPDDLLQAARRIELECPKGIGRIELEAALRDERRCIGLSGDVVQRTAGVLEQLPLEAPAPRRQHQGQQNPARALRRSWSSAFDRRRSLHAPISFVASSFGAAATKTAPPGASAEQKSALDHSDAISIELPSNLVADDRHGCGRGCGAHPPVLLARVRLFDGLGCVLAVVR